jgi:energy-coupling factor transporter ATP-binding protein EcfA2
MKKNESRDIKIRKLRIVDYKGFDELEIEFPGPRMSGDPDVTVMGSRNGLGKTSVLECCALLLMGLSPRVHKIGLKHPWYMPVDLPEMIIRAGASTAQLAGEIVIDDKAIELKMEIDKSGNVTVDSRPDIPANAGSQEEEKLVGGFISTVSGMNPNPLLADNFLYFHSYRKVQEGNPDLGSMVEGDSSRRPGPPSNRPPMSTFKLLVLRSMMIHAKLFEQLADDQSGDILATLNELVKRYAGGKIEKLRPSSDNTVDFRIQPVNGGPSFTFDGLSSGQKEIISTLFLVWNLTGNKPGIVLIDEPELHLNHEWHRDFVRQLTKIAPHNQYIIATHSEDIFASVDKDRRLLLQGAIGAIS